MNDDWVTVTHAQEIFGRALDEIDDMARHDGVQVIHIEDETDRPITLIPRGYAERKAQELGKRTPMDETMAHLKLQSTRMATTSPTDTAPPPDETPSPIRSDGQEAQGAFAPPAANAARPLAELGGIITDRYEAVIEALRSHEPNRAIQQNLTELTKAFEVTSEAIQGMNQMHRVTTAGLEASLARQGQVMENVLTSLQTSDQNTAGVMRYQQDFVDAVNRLPEPLQAIQDVQLGLIDLEEKRITLEKGRVRFDQTAAGRALSMFSHVLLVVLLLTALNICAKILWNFPDLMGLLRTLKGAM